MISPPLPSNERQRLATLRSLKLLDTPAEERFDRITRLARKMFDVPIALVSLVDADRQWFKSNQGMDVCQSPRGTSFCGHTILREEPLVVQDAFEDERFRDNPLVTGDPNIRFYAGYPLSAPDGSKLGSLCLIDRRPRTMSGEDLATLRELGRLIESELMAMNLATSDALTGVSNLRGFLEIGGHVLALSTRFAHSLQLLMVKIARIEEFYQKHGSIAAERALVEVAQILLSSFRESDLVARIGEGEFGVLLMGRATTWTDPALKRVRELIEDLNVYRSPELQIAAKVVSESFNPQRHGSLEDLIAGAEKRLP
jgi:diguanylate cyclase (GGDEF)-like protein